MRRAATRRSALPSSWPRRAARSALSCRARAPGARAQPGGLCRIRGDGDRGDGRVRDGDRQARRPLRRACRRSPSRSRLITRRPAAPGATAIRPKRGCSGRREDFARARQRIETEVEPDRRAGERERLNALAALVEAPAAAAQFCLGISARIRRNIAAIATIASIRRRRSMRPRSRASCCRRRSAPRCGSASRHLADVLAGNDSEKVRSFGHDRLSVFGIATRRGTGAGPSGRAGADCARCAARRCLWRAEFRARREGHPQRRASSSRSPCRRRASAPAASASTAPPIRCSMRCAKLGGARGRSRRSALCHLPRLDPARDRRRKPRDLNELSAVQGVGASQAGALWRSDARCAFGARLMFRLA